MDKAKRYKDIMFESSSKELTRRKFLTTAGLGLIAASAMGDMTQPASAQQSTSLPPKIKLPPWLAPTEKTSAGPQTALPSDKRLGFALVGLGRLTLEELLPAFAETKRCKPAALVSGNLDKAATVAQQYGINPKNIYSY